MEINQNNKNGANVITNNYNYIADINIDVGRLKQIVEEHSQNIKELLKKLTNPKEQSYIDNDYIPIRDKNKKNDLVEFYDKWIKKHESKFKILADFIKDNSLSQMIDNASSNIKMAIFSYSNKKNDTLTPEIFNLLIQKHTKELTNTEDKEIMALLLFFLYRECFIGAKE